MLPATVPFPRSQDSGLLHLRITVFICALLACAAAPQGMGAAPATLRRGPERLQGSHEQPLPFLGSGGVAVQVPATESSPGLVALRARGTSRLPLRAPAAAGRRLRAAAPSSGQRAVSVRACRLGTPPPSPRSGRAACPALPVRA